MGSTPTRRLAAILAADVVGYSRLMGRDEEGTHRRIRALRTAIIEPSLANHSGRLVKTTGDGFLIEFSSVVSAFRYASEVQEALALTERTDDPDALRMRIGINVGDVIADEGDLFGDGVNVAARVEQLSPPGGICVSERAWLDLRQLAVPFVDMGPQELKNISEPIRTFAVGPIDWKPDLKPSALAPRTPSAKMPQEGAVRELPVDAPRGRIERVHAEQSLSRSADQASIAVLPFESRGGEAVHGYLADGLAEELISRLAQVPGLKVPARTSSFAYRGRATDVRTIAAELGVATVLEGSVRASADRVRISTQLIDASNGFQTWSRNFDRTLTDLLDLQDDLAEAIAAALKFELGPRLRETDSSEAMRLVLEARDATRSISREGLLEAIRLAREAIALDPNFAKAWESLAGTTLVMANSGFIEREAFTEAASHAERAIALDPRLSGPHTILATIDAARGNMLKAAERLEFAEGVDKGKVMTGEQAALGVFLPMGLTARATALAEASLELAPSRTQPHLVVALCSATVGDFARAAQHLDRALALGMPPARPPVEVLQSEIAWAAGDTAAAAAPMARLVTRQLAVPGAAAAVEAVYAALAGSPGREEALRALADMSEAADRSGSLWLHPIGASLIMQWQARLDALDAAFATARRVVERWRETGRLATGCLSAFWSPPMVPFRRDPRFQALIRELDLIGFWEKYGPPDGHQLVGGRMVTLD